METVEPDRSGKPGGDQDGSADPDPLAEDGSESRSRGVVSDRSEPETATQQVEISRLAKVNGYEDRDHAVGDVLGCSSEEAGQGITKWEAGIVIRGLGGNQGGGGGVTKRKNPELPWAVVSSCLTVVSYLLIPGSAFVTVLCAILAALMWASVIIGRVA